MISSILESICSSPAFSYQGTKGRPMKSFWRLPITAVWSQVLVIQPSTETPFVWVTELHWAFSSCLVFKRVLKSSKVGSPEFLLHLGRLSVIHHEMLMTHLSLTSFHWSSVCLFLNYMNIFDKQLMALSYTISIYIQRTIYPFFCITLKNGI